MIWGNGSQTGKRAWLLTGVMAAALCALPAQAAEKQHFDVPAGDAAQSVQTLAQQSGLQVLAPNADLQGVRSNAVQGDYDPIEALRRMLDGTGLKVAQTNPNTVTITRATAAIPEETGEEIIVTGSRIERAGFDTLEAATVDSAAQIERRGYVNVAEALEANPLFGISDSGIGSNQSPSATGQRFVNLFNLGSQRTLTLVNGHRFVSANSPAAGSGIAAGSQVDINLIPTGLVDRVETIAIGGAPIYGSDAIAGTVNIILKDNFQGLELTGLGGINEASNYHQYSARALAGTNFSDERGNITASVEYSKQSGLLYSDRFGSLKITVRNPANTSDTDGIPAVMVVNDFRFDILTEGGLPYFESGARDALAVDGPGVALPPFGIAPNGNYIFDANGQPLQFGANGELVPFHVGTVVDDLLEDSGASAFGTFPLASEGGDGLSLANSLSLLTPTERVLGNILGHYDITPNLRFSAEADYAHTHVVRLSDLTSVAAPGLIGGPLLTFSVDNPFLSDQARSIILANGLTSFHLNRNLNDIVQREPQQTTENLYRFVGGFDGHFDVGGQTWHWDASYNYGRVRNRSQITYVDPDRFALAVDAVRAADGSIVCADATAVGCQPLNLFGYGAPSQQAVDYVKTIGHASSLNVQTVLNANVGGKLPLGLFAADPIAFNLGVERRVEKAVFSPDEVLQGGDALLGRGIGAFSPVSGKFSTKEVYGELVVPLVSEGQGMAVIRSAELDGSIRYVDNSVNGGATTWSVGGRLSPRLGGGADGLTFRGVYTRAIRAPAVSELFAANSPTTVGLGDPCDEFSFNRGNNPNVRTANCTAALAAAGGPPPASFISTTGVVSASGTISGNPNLDNEKARSWSAGAVYQPEALPNFHVAADWTDIRLTGGIGALGINGQLASCYDSPNFPNDPACSTFTRLTAADIAAGNGTGGVNRNVGDVSNGFNETFINTARLHFAGLIVSADYNFGIGRLWGDSDDGNSVRFGTTVFYTDKFDSVTFDGQPADHAAGRVGQPKWRVQGNVGLTVGPTDFDVQVLWRDKTKYSLVATIEDTPINDVGAYTLVNGTIGFNVNEAFKLQLIVNNIFDKDVPFPAIVNSSFGAFDFLGRNYMVTATARF